jgi:signal transduction histidine kinase
MTALPFLAEDSSPRSGAAAWRILVVDDDASMLAVTRLALSAFTFDGRPVELLSAISAAQARDVWAQERGIALVLLDVVMETDHAGLDFVRFIREDQGDDRVRIILRTGQAGQVPALQIMQQYEIDGYLTKADLTFERLILAVTTALRAYRLLQKMHEHQRALERSNTDLARSNRELEQFAYVASHDLQVPLRSVVGFCQILQAQFDGRLGEDADQYLHFIVTGAVRMQALIRELLAFSRLGHGDAAFAPVDCAALLELTRETLQPAILESGATIDSTPLPVVQGSEGEIGRLFQNLIGNAIKFRGDRKPLIQVSAKRDGDRWLFAVRDNGIGIQPEQCERVFEIFQRLHRQDEYEGTGIGLAICRKVVERHGGRIWVESEAGSGSTFFFTLPAG